jgi:4-hydroxy-3-polyprenylbenzoate decarboxylase
MNFRQQLVWLKRQNHLITVDQPVDSHLEAAEIVRRITSLHHPTPPALLFNALSSPGPYSVIANLYASAEHLSAMMTTAFGRNVATALEQLPDEVPAQVSLSAWLSEQGGFWGYGDTQTIASHVRLKNLDAVPLLRYWPGDAGDYLSFALLITRGIEGQLNVGIYRLQRCGTDELTVHFRAGSQAALLCDAYRRAGKKMPAAVVLGVPLSVVLSAVLPLPGEVDELSFAGWLQGEKLMCAKSPEHSLPIPECEFLLEGEIDPQLMAKDGPHGNHSGYYTSSVACPVLKLTSLSARPDAICPVSVVGPPPTESFTLARIAQDYYCWELRRRHPHVVKVRLLANGVFQGVMVIQLCCRLDESQRDGLLTDPLVKTSRLVVLVDENVDEDNLPTLLWRGLNHVGQGRVYENSCGIVLDTTCLDGRDRLVSDPTIQENVDKRWRELGLGQWGDGQ